MLLSQKKIGIFGLGKTGIESYQALKDNALLVCYDDQVSKLDEFITQFGATDIGDLLDSRWQGLDKILVSPGIPFSQEIFTLANLHNIYITSDIDLLFEENSNSNFISITGTNGKSTTTSLTAHIFAEAGLDYTSGGNIGTAALSLDFNKQGYILELSSFQIDLLKSFKTKIAVLLNITPDHLDRYKTMEAYIASKKKIFSHLDENGFFIIGADNPITKNIAKNFAKSTIQIIPISALEIQKHGISVLQAENSLNIYDNIFEPIALQLQQNQYLRGTHNRENIAASYAVCRIAGIERSKIIAGINNFRGLPHRMEYIGIIDGINFYNDSKATNSDSASKSLDTLDNIYWLAGGIVKDDRIKDLNKWAGKIRKAYFFGKDKELLGFAMNGKVEFQICQDLEEAFNNAFNDANKERVEFKNILLSPACASFDQFRNFEHRGDVFVKLCKEKFR